MHRSIHAFLMVLTVLAPMYGPVYGQSDELRVLPDKKDTVAPRDMMKTYLLRLADTRWEAWQQDYEKRLSPEQITTYQQRLRRQFIDALGGLPQRTALNPRITGVVRRQDYRVEKVIFESQTKHFVTALMFIPETSEFRPPYPAVLIPCGHSRNGKGESLYQTQAAALALRGMAALVFDPIDQGERAQLLDENQKPPIWGTRAHTMVGVSSILLGRNTARFEIWDGMRALDYLQSHPSVDARRLGCTGNSGGGTQTAYFMALDERIYAAAPSCYLTTFNRLMHTIGCQDAEQNIFGQLAFGMDHPDYIMMRAPQPTLICAATKDFFDIQGTWQTFRYAKRLYTRLGYAERINLVENDDTHGYKKFLREGALRWMARWLLGEDKPYNEPPIELLNEEEVRCTPRGEVMLLPEARSVYDLNRDYANELAQKRKLLWRNSNRSEIMEKIRQITGIRHQGELPEPKIEKGTVIKREGYQIEKVIINPEEGIYLPALKFIPETSQEKPVVLYLHEEGKSADAGTDGSIQKLVKQGYAVLAVDLRGNGETKQDKQTYGRPYFGTDGQDAYAAYVQGRSYVGMRAEDVLVCARYVAKQSGNNQAVRLMAVGNVSVPALHAAALEPDLFASVHLKGMLISWSNLIEKGLHHNQLINAIHGALTVYDLPDLVTSLGEKITLEQPVDCMGRAISNSSS